ncbi:MAG: hypothetical protein WBD23_12735 [Candidatus Acidiferrales bacterium]
MSRPNDLCPQSYTNATLVCYLWAFSNVAIQHDLSRSPSSTADLDSLLDQKPLFQVSLATIKVRLFARLEPFALELFANLAAGYTFREPLHYLDYPPVNLARFARSDGYVGLPSCSGSGL